MNELEFKAGLAKAIQKYMDTLAEKPTWSNLEIGSIPYNLEVSMAEAAFAVIMAVKWTNKYRDENCES